MIWQQKVSPDLQGRIFAIWGAITMATPTLAYLIAGPLGDRVFEPMLAANGVLASSLGRIIGVGQGRGIPLLVICMGLSVMLASVAGCINPRLQKVEVELPDA